MSDEGQSNEEKNSRAESLNRSITCLIHARQRIFSRAFLQKDEKSCITYKGMILFEHPCQDSRTREDRESYG